MRLLRRRPQPGPRAKTFRPAERYLAGGAEVARRFGHRYIGTEHILLALSREPEGGAARVLAELGVSREDVETTLRPCLGPPGPRIDPDALAALGIDLDVVRERLQETFGPDALEQTRHACLSVAPRLKLALTYAVDHAGEQPVRDEHVLLGILSVPESLAATMLATLGVSFDSAEAVVRNDRPEP
jgi:ATP-dependent Clp protease ATP-binding subunit ClpA